MKQLLTDKFEMKKAQSPSAWAEANVQIPAGNARPGPISFRDAPYQREIVDKIVDPHVQRLTMKTCAQAGKTMIALITLGYFTDERPMSQMFMQPTETDMKKWLTTKFDPMLDANPRLKALYAPPRGREGTNNRVMKDFRGGHLVLAWAGSTNTMRGISAPIIICDEIDGYEHSPEGHPVDLLWRRSATFGEKRKLLELSTPTIIHESRIENAFLQGNQCQFEVVCSDCHEPWIFAWEHVKYDAEDASTAKIHCPHCDRGYSDTERIRLVRYAESDGGGWKPMATTKRHWSYQLSGLYSPLQRLQDIVQVFIDADDPNKLATFWNTCMGETFEKTGETAEAHELESRCENYPAQVPEGVKVLTAGIDVQKDRLECEVVGWGQGEESWHIAYEVFHGDTNNPNDQCYKYLTNFLQKGFEYETGGRMFIESAAIDSGFNTLSIYQFVRNRMNGLPGIWAVKGIGGWNRDVLKGVKAQMTYKGYRPPLFSIGVDTAKRILMQQLNVAKPGQGYCHFPIECAEGDYFNQLTSEVLLYDPRTGKRKWEKKDGGPNEALDCRIYAYAALHIRKPDLEVEGVRYGLRGVKKNQKVEAKPAIKTFGPNW